MSLVREMSVASASRFKEITDKSLWRILKHYMGKAMARLNLSDLSAVGLDETSLRIHAYITVFIDMDRPSKPVIFATPGKGKYCFQEFKDHLQKHGGSPENVAEIFCDMSSVFLAAAEQGFQEAEITVDWFHVVKLFNDALEKVRRKEEQKQVELPKYTRLAILKGEEKDKT